MEIDEKLEELLEELIDKTWKWSMNIYIQSDCSDSPYSSHVQVKKQEIHDYINERYKK